MRVIYCDLCNGRIDDRLSNELNIEYRAKINNHKYFSIEDIKDKLPISTEWKEIDICVNCLKEIIKRKQEKDKE